MTLRWEKPKEVSICYYIIQKKEYRDTGWQEALIINDQNCVTTTQDKLEVQVPGLKEGRWYQFRVVAVNTAGKSDPSPQTKLHVCKSKSKFCPFVNRNDFNDVIGPGLKGDSLVDKKLTLLHNKLQFR